MQIRAFAAHQQGADLQPYSFEVDAPKNHECVVKVLACGICHSDLHMVDNDWGGSRYPLVPGHEVIGEVVETGPQVSHLKVGDRVGIGWQSLSCLTCKDCLRGNENLCSVNNRSLIGNDYGGFADYVAVDSRFAFPIPQGIATEDAGPLLCAGVTVYAGLHYGGMTSGQEIGVIGVGGLGHLAVQFASRLGNRVTVFTTSEDKAQFAKELGAHQAIVVPAGEAVPAPDRPLNLIISTVPAALNWTDYLKHLDSDGTLVMVGVPPEPLNVPLTALLSKRRRIMASPIGGRALIMEMLSIAERFQIRPIVETFSFDQANEAFQRVRDNKVRYRAVLVR